MTTRLYNDPKMYRKPGKQNLTEKQRLVVRELVGAPLEVLFPNEDWLIHMLNLTLLKTMATFADPTGTYMRTLKFGQNRLGMLNPEHGRRKAVWENFLPVAGEPSVEQLAELVARTTPYANKFVRVEDLPRRARRLPEKHLESIRAHARYMLALRVVEVLVDEQTELWYHEGDKRHLGGWQMSSSLMSQRQDLQRMLKGLQPLHPHFRKKFDRRNYHGRPNCARGRSHVPPGASTGGHFYKR